MHYAKHAAMTLTLTLLFVQAPHALSQDPPIAWGDIPKADLEMKSYPPDSGASAIILADYGESGINGDFCVTFKRHTRLKILNPAGYSWGTQSIPLYTREEWDKLENVEGITYSLQPDGSIQKTELEKNAVFAETADETSTTYRFTLPALKPGCVIEFRYAITYKGNVFMPTWRFQHMIPTLWSEYRTLIPTTMAYAKATFTFEPFFIKETTRKPVHGTNPYTGQSSTLCDVSRWVMRDLPALLEEPFITTVDDYTPQVRLQLAEFAVPGRGGIEKVLKTWDTVVEELLNDDRFGRLLGGGRDLQETTQRVIAGKSAPLDKMAALYDHMRLTMVWNGAYRVRGSAPDELLKSRKGDSGDINLLLIAMLRSAGLDAIPVIASTRSHGKITDIYPLVDQFNTVAARVAVGGWTYYLDATDPLRPYDLVAPQLLNVSGLLIREGPVEWVTIASKRRSLHRSMANVTLNADGAIHGALGGVDKEYGALLERSRLKKTNPMDVARDMFDAEQSGLSLDSATVSNGDSTSDQVRVEAIASGASYAQAAGNFIYFNPIVVDRMRANPFRLKERKFPVDMSFGRDIIALATVHVPPEFEIKEVPKDIQLGGEDIMFSRRTVASGDSVQTVTHLKIAVTVFPPEYYESLKGFYDQIVAAESQQVVLQHRTQTAVPETGPAPKRSTKGAKKK